MEYLFVVAGLVCLYFGGEWLVEGAIGVSRKLGLPAFLISLTVVGFGTSMPELLVSLKAAIGGYPGIVLGNVVGSNIANILLIVGLAALIAPIQVIRSMSGRDAVTMVLSAIVLVIVLIFRTISPLIGVLMLLALVAYLAMAYMQDKNAGCCESDQLALPVSPYLVLALLVFGLALLVVGADLLVRGATIVAQDLGVSSAVIGLTVVAVGTSLPELATSVVAAVHRRSDIAIGNIIGSNIFNILGILGLTSLICPIPVADRFAQIDGWVMLGSTLLLFVLLFSCRRIGRVVGGGFLVAYIAYVISMM
ncbi:calcium/sodium antiporter [uncultured Cohaesibacter sp.]|uniref:calcium/sodium antiporter n=1 Tax=uncultured Cohaesibacter sp. TaxID=1002546 RepID=UPI00292CE1B3|nr:calcium/sodium antiporter [uncultured Cohaesibacter sp.]